MIALGDTLRIDAIRLERLDPLQHRSKIEQSHRKMFVVHITLG